MIPEPVLRELAAKMPFYKIAKIYGCKEQSISALAKRYGISPKFKAKGEQPGERERIQELRTLGWAIARIGKELNRSHEFVIRRLGHRVQKPQQQTGPRLDWPRPVPGADKALEGKMFEDFRIPAGKPINASMMTRYSEPSVGCAARMCEEA